MRTVKTSNIINLAELRRRQPPDRRGNLDWQTSLVRQSGEDLWLPEEASAFRPVVLTVSREERVRARRERRAWCLDVCASLAVILMTAVFALQVLL